MTTRTHFAFRIDMWSPDGSSIIEHIAGVEDFQIAQATYRAAVDRWPGGAITLRQGARVIEDSRRTRFASWAARAGRADGDNQRTPMADRDSRSHHRRGYRTAIAIVGVMTAKNSIMICAFIFDLDNCLAAAREVGEDLYEPAFEAIRRANRGVISSTVLNSAFEDMWRYPLDWVAARYGFSQEMLEAGWEIFSKLDVKGKLHGYGDAPILSELDGKRFLVTSGFRRLQESKIAALNLTHLFTGIYVDAIDEANRLGKLGIFAHILEAHGLTAAEVLVVGDNADSEIAAGNRLGMPTAQILRPGVLHATNATFHIHTLNELKDLAAHWC